MKMKNLITEYLSVACWPLQKWRPDWASYGFYGNNSDANHGDDGDDVGSVCDYDIDDSDVVDNDEILVPYLWSATGAFSVGGISLEPLI